MTRARAIYFVQVGDSGPVKIGSTSMDPSLRRSQIQSGCPWPLHLIGTLSDGTATERELHRRFGAHRLAGEWFEPVPELLEFIGENCIPSAPRVLITPRGAPWLPTEYGLPDASTAAREFLLRVRGYCNDGITQPEMAKREQMNLTSFRERVLRCGFRFETTTARELVRTGTGEPLSAFLGGLEVAV